MSYDCSIEKIQQALHDKLSTDVADPKCLAAQEAGVYTGTCTVTGGGFPDTYVMDGQYPLCFKPGTNTQVDGLNSGEVCAIGCAPHNDPNGSPMVQWDHGNTYFQCGPIKLPDGSYPVVPIAMGCDEFAAQKKVGYGTDSCQAAYSGNPEPKTATDLVCTFASDMSGGTSAGASVM